MRDPLTGLVMAVVMIAAVVLGFAGLCGVLGFGYYLVVDGVRGRLALKTWDEYASKGLYVWVGAWIFGLPSVAIGDMIFGKGFLDYLGTLLKNPLQPANLAQLTAAFLLLPLAYIGSVAVIALLSSQASRLLLGRGHGYSAHLVGWLLAGYLGLAAIAPCVRR